MSDRVASKLLHFETLNQPVVAPSHTSRLRGVVPVHEPEWEPCHAPPLLFYHALPARVQSARVHRQHLAERGVVEPIVLTNDPQASAR